MVETRLDLEDEVRDVFQLIDEGKNFVLSGGAGSGKTYSLVETIREILIENSSCGIACVTYTNAAVREIVGRFADSHLTVSTIHDFLWDNVKSYQRELKGCIRELIEDEAIEKFKMPATGVPPDYSDLEIRYKEYFSLKDGIISHDEVIFLADYMFGKYPKLCSILKDRYKFILVDEYQDTDPLVVRILLTHLKQSPKRCIVGFYGDSMQAIYDDSVGNLENYRAQGDVFEVRKIANRRNPRSVYELANRLRTDGLVQNHSQDGSAPNMANGVVKSGTARFFYSNASDRLDDLKTRLGWDFTKPKLTKELNLTHNLIAPRAGFSSLMKIYDGDKVLEYRKRIKDYISGRNITDDFSGLTFGQVIEILLEGKTTATERRPIEPTPGQQTFINANAALFQIAKNYNYEEFLKIHVDKESLIDDKKEDGEETGRTGSKRDALIKHLMRIQENVDLYRSGKVNEFLRRTEFTVTSVADKVRIKEVIERISNMATDSIESVIRFADENGICRIDDRLTGFIAKKKYLYDQVKEVQFSVFQSLFDYLMGYTSHSTQHKIKGAQFDNVLIVLQDGAWSKYNFGYLFEGQGTESVALRTRKLFYVCCTRPKENLAVYFQSPSPAVITQAQEWFGTENVREI